MDRFTVHILPEKASESRPFSIRDATLRDVGNFDNIVIRLDDYVKAIRVAHALNANVTLQTFLGGI
jgi:hypothetical protein